MPVQNSESAIEVAQNQDLTVPKSRKLAKSKKAIEGLTALQLQENQLVVDAAQAGYDSPVYAAAGSAFLQGGQQKFLETICGGYGTFIKGVSRNVGQYREPANFDAWETVDTKVEEMDVWA